MQKKTLHATKTSCNAYSLCPFHRICGPLPRFIPGKALDNGIVASPIYRGSGELCEPIGGNASIHS